MRLIIITSLLLISINKRLSAQQYSCDFIIDTNTTYIDSITGSSISPGDTVCLMAGNRDKLLIKYMQGCTDKPIVLINYGGSSNIYTSYHYGMSFNHCRHIKISGKGVDSISYGIKILKVEGGAGLGLTDFTTDVEIENLEIANTLTSGIAAKTDPDCTFKAVRDSFTMRNLVIHDNYIHDVGNEGMYIGSTKYTGQTIHCNGQDTTVFPHLLENVLIFNNHIERAGWDGLQISSASDSCRIFENWVLYDSQDEQNNQMSGIILGNGSDCDCYSNLVRDGKGIGIENHQLGGNLIYNNVIINAGRDYFPGDPTKRKYGIFVPDHVYNADSAAYHIHHNTIISPKTDGIRFSNTNSRDNVFYNNIIVNPGAYYYYDSITSSTTPMDAFINVTDANIGATYQHNLLKLSQYEVCFADTSSYDYQLKANSPAIDYGINLSFLGIVDDFNYVPRPFGQSYDAGAFEFDSIFYSSEEVFSHPEEIKIYPNPAKDLLKIYIKGKDESTVSISLLNMEGKCLRKKSTKIWDFDSHTFELNVRNIRNGMYFIQIQTKNQLNNYKIIIHHD